jgi:hypothetical protein
MRKAFGKAAVALMAAALSSQATAFADGYGCATCYGPPSPPPCPTQPAACCQQPSVQHVHYHQKHCLFGHHQAPMMMPMTAPVVQVPMAMQQQVAVSAVPTFAVAAAPAAFTTAAVPATFAVASNQTFTTAALASPTFSIGAANVGFSAANFGVASQSGASPFTSAGMSAGEVSQLRALAAELRAAAADAGASAASAQASAASTQTDIDLLKDDVADLKAKFDCLRACLAK